MTGPTADWGPTSSVYAASYRLMLRVAYTITGSREAAEDVVHDAFCAVGPKLASVDDPVPYVRVAVVNRCRSVHRKTTAESDRLRRATAGLGDLVDDHGLTADHTDLAAALDRLPFNQRAAVVLRYLVDLPDREIADALGCRQATVRSHLRRGLAALRKELS